MSSVRHPRGECDRRRSTGSCYKLGVTGERRAKREREQGEPRDACRWGTEVVLCLRRIVSRIVAFVHEFHVATSQALYPVSSSSGVYGCRSVCLRIRAPSISVTDSLNRKRVNFGSVFGGPTVMTYSDSFDFMSCRVRPCTRLQSADSDRETRRRR
jgi:hypothetical protein